MHAMSENTAISSFEVFIEADCSNLVGGTEEQGVLGGLQILIRHAVEFKIHQNSANLCQMFSRKQRVFRRVFESLRFVNG